MSKIEEMENALVPVPQYVVPTASPHAQAMEAHARATVNARYIMAMQNRRVWDRVRQEILKECRRPSFAKDKSALYKKPVGTDGVEGLGVRFVEMALSKMTNILVENHVIFEDELRRVINVSVTDLEANVTQPKEITVMKTVERSRPLDDGSYISVRTNSRGKFVYLVPSTEDEMLNKEAAMVSKALRMCGLRLIPGDLQDEAWDAIMETRKNEAAKDPDADRKEIVDGFTRLNVPADQLIEYVGHDLATCSPEELAELRTVWGTIRDGEGTWAATIELRRQQRAKTSQDASTGKGATTPATQGQQAQARNPRHGKWVKEAEAKVTHTDKQSTIPQTASGQPIGQGDLKRREVLLPGGKQIGFHDGEVSLDQMLWIDNSEWFVESFNDVEIIVAAATNDG